MSLEARDIIILFLFAGLIAAVTVGTYLYRRLRRKELLEAPFPKEWDEILKSNIPLYKRMPEKLQNELHGLINIFIDEKDFEGCGGLEITDEVKVTIAAQACTLLLNRHTSFYPKLKTILVYPDAYIATGPGRIGGQHVDNEESARLGESWLNGAVVLSWDHVKSGADNIHDGHNVVLHEFAHQLDQEDGAGDGVPLLEHRSDYPEWAKVFSEEFAHLQDDVAHHRKDIIDAYGATNPAEFFAVATETFFEKSKQMSNKHPELYQALKQYYQLDPVEWE